MNKNNILIVENIRIHASDRGMNVSKVEKACGFANGTIGKWAKAPKSPPFDKVFKVVECLGVRLEDIVGDDCKFLSDSSSPEIKNDTTVSSDVDPRDIEFARLFNKLTDTEKDIVIAQMRGIAQGR